MDYHDIIPVEFDKRGGQPCIRGLRITVYDVLSYLASGMTEEEILSDYPDLTHEDILASLSYAADRERKTAVSHRHRECVASELPRRHRRFCAGPGEGRPGTV